MKNLFISKKNLKFEFNSNIEMGMNFLSIENKDPNIKKAIKLKCTDIKSFVVKPRRIILNPLESVNIKIGFIMKNKKTKILNSDDYFCLYAVDIFELDDFNNYFKKNKKYVEKQNIQIIFEKPLIKSNLKKTLHVNKKPDNLIEKKLLKKTTFFKKPNFDHSFPNTKNHSLRTTTNRNSIISSQIKNINSLKAYEIDIEGSRILEFGNYEKILLSEMEKRIRDIIKFNEILEKEVKILEHCVSNFNHKVGENFLGNINLRIALVVFIFGIFFGFFLNK